MKKVLVSAVAGLLLLSAGANAETLKLDGFTSALQTVNVSASPVPNTPSAVGGSGFKLTDTTGSMGSFIGWCLDIGHTLMGVGQSQKYNVTTNPFSNSYGLTTEARKRIQSVFDANFGSVDVTSGVQAAAFQMALWEAAFEGSANATSVSNGLFQASGSGTTALANTYLTNAANYTGNKVWNLTFLQVAGLDAKRGSATGQNLVTAAPVPLPAAGLLLLTAFAGTTIMARRRRTA